MDREVIIRRTLENLSKLPDNRLEEVSRFTEFLLRNIDESILTEGIKELTSKAKAFKYLEEEEDIYTVNDLKEKYK